MTTAHAAGAWAWRLSDRAFFSSGRGAPWRPNPQRPAVAAARTFTNTLPRPVPRRRPIRDKRDILPTLNALRAPLPPDVSATPLHKIQGAAQQPSVEAVPGSWWDALLVLALAPPPPRQAAAAITVSTTAATATAATSSAAAASAASASSVAPRQRCAVVSIPLLGLGNRLRALASAAIYAEAFGCTLHFAWTVAPDMPHAWPSLFAELLPPPPASFYAAPEPPHSVRPPATRTAVS